MAQHFRLPDGRNIDYLVSGAQDGLPLVWIHGTPGAYCADPGLSAACEKKGVKVITLSRAGYGGSTRNKGRRVVDEVEDIRALIGYLGVERCLVGGWSGGGPHALACAARLPGCIAALCVAGVAPYPAEDLDWLAGQGEDNIEEFHVSLQGEEALQKFCEAQRPEMLKGTVAAWVEALSSLLPDVDKEALLGNAEMGEYVVASTSEALRINCDGWVDDSLSFIEPWGFELSEVQVPVLLYQGSEDKMVPYAHGEWLAKNLPQEGLKNHLQQGQGHISIFLGQRDSMIDGLLAIAKQ